MSEHFKGKKYLHLRCLRNFISAASRMATALPLNVLLHVYFSGRQSWAQFKQLASWHDDADHGGRVSSSRHRGFHGSCCARSLEFLVHDTHVSAPRQHSLFSLWQAAGCGSCNIQPPETKEQRKTHKSFADMQSWISFQVRLSFL